MLHHGVKDADDRPACGLVSKQVRPRREGNHPEGKRHAVRASTEIRPHKLLTYAPRYFTHTLCTPWRVTAASKPELPSGGKYKLH